MRVTLKDHLRPLAALATNSQPGRAAAYRHFFWGAARRTLPAIAVDDQGMRFYLETTDHIISRQTFMNGVYELDTMKAALSLIEDQAGVTLRGRGFIDVGANIGTTTVPALKLFGAAKGLAFEPSTVNVRRLKINLLANELDDRVQVVRAAVSNAPGQLELELNGENNHGDNRIRMGVASQGEFGEDRWQTESVSVTTLDEAAEMIEDPAVLWIDTQGHEGHVLAGAKSLVPFPRSSNTGPTPCVGHRAWICCRR